MRRLETPYVSTEFSSFHLLSNEKTTVISWQTNIIFTILLLLFSPISYAQIKGKTDSPEDKQTPVLKSQGGDSLELETSLDEVNLVEQGGGRLELLEVEQSPAQISAELRFNLESQFKQIQELIKTENAYSERLGEAYFSYALLLQKVGRIDEARKMLVDALHNSKVNEGVYSIEQRPILRALFENNLISNKTEDLVATFEKIVWLENKTPSEIGDYSFDLALKLGHYFLDLYLIRGLRDDVSLDLLNSAADYFSYAIRRYGNYALDELLMPYGELSEVHLYRSKILERTTKQRISPFAQRGSAFDRSEQKRSRIVPAENTFSRAEFFSTLHLRKAESENNQEQIIISLLALGDSSLLFNRKKQAAKYYKSAWEEAQKLDVNDRVRQSFEQPVRLPAFNYALDKEEPRRQGATYAHLAVMVDINEHGKVVNVSSGVGAINKKVASRAKRVAKSSKFRPVINHGEMIASSQHKESIRVLIKK